MNANEALFKDVPVGARLEFGTHPYDAGKCIQWVKVNEEGHLISEPLSMSIDSPRRSSGKNRDVRINGLCYYPETFIHKYLNSGADRWYDIACVSAGDDRPRYSNKPGFLSMFEPDERTAMKPMNICVQAQTGYTKAYGTEEKTFQCLACLPSIYELRGESLDGTTQDGVKWTVPFEKVFGRYWGTSTRTSITGKTFMHFCKAWQRHDSFAPRWVCGTSVEICLNEDTKCVKHAGKTIEGWEDVDVWTVDGNNKVFAILDDLLN